MDFGDGSPSLVIESCSFGSIVISGKRYDSDLIICPDDRVITGWRREKGHRLSIGDLEPLLSTHPEVIVAGTGVNGRVEPEADLHQALGRRGIELIAVPNNEAMDRFNRLSGQRRVGACFHLTC